MGGGNQNSGGAAVRANPIEDALKWMLAPQVTPEQTDAWFNPPQPTALPEPPPEQFPVGPGMHNLRPSVMASEIGGEIKDMLNAPVELTKRAMDPQLSVPSRLAAAAGAIGAAAQLDPLLPHGGRAGKVKEPPPPGAGAEVVIPDRFRLVGSRGRGTHKPTSDYDIVTELSPKEYEHWITTPEGEYPRLPKEVTDAAHAGHDTFIQVGNKAYKVEPHPVDEGQVVVERVSQNEQSILSGAEKPPPPGAGIEQAGGQGVKAEVTKQYETTNTRPSGVRQVAGRAEEVGTTGEEVPRVRTEGSTDPVLVRSDAPVGQNVWQKYDPVRSIFKDLPEADKAHEFLMSHIGPFNVDKFATYTKMSPGRAKLLLRKLVAARTLPEGKNLLAEYGGAPSEKGRTSRNRVPFYAQGYRDWINAKMPEAQ